MHCGLLVWYTYTGNERLKSSPEGCVRYPGSLSLSRIHDMHGHEDSFCSGVGLPSENAIARERPLSQVPVDKYLTFNSAQQEIVQNRFNSWHWLLES